MTATPHRREEEPEPCEQYIPAGCHVTEDLDGERFVRNRPVSPATVRTAQLATLRELLGHLRNTEPAEEEWIAAMEWSLREHEQPKFEPSRIEVLRLEPEDVLVLSYPGKLTARAIGHLSEMMRERFSGRKLVILDDGLTLGAVREAD